MGMLTTDTQTERAIHEKQEVIKLLFAYDVDVVARIQKIKSPFDDMEI
jgi:hypothetical protein